MFYVSRRVYVRILKISGKSGKFSEKTRRSKFPGISKWARFEFGNSRLGSVNLVFSQNVFCEVHTCKLKVKLIKIICVSRPWNPWKSRKNPWKPSKKSAFFSCFLMTHTKIQLHLKILVPEILFQESFPKIFRVLNSNFRKTPKMTVLKNQPTLRSVFYIHFYELKIVKKKRCVFTPVSTLFSEILKFSPEKIAN
jgi:hypothetical protein